MDYIQQTIGFFSLLLAGIMFSNNLKAIRIRYIISAVSIQLILALLLIKVPIVTGLFKYLSEGVLSLKYASDQGVSFVFGYLADGAPNAPFEIIEPANTFIFAFAGLSLVIVVSALSALLWHWKIIPFFINALSVLFKKPLNVGGPAGLGATANIIFGQVEAPLLIKPYLSSMTKRELLILMTVGMATISGSVMVVFVTFLDNIYDPSSLIGHFLIASIISVPAAIMYANIMIPEDKKTEFPGSSESNLYSSSMDAITTGTSNGLNIFLNIIALLIVIIALITLLNIILLSMPDFNGLPLSLERVTGWFFSPVAWCMGIPWDEAQIAGELLGIKTIFNEFIAYMNLANLEPKMSERSNLIMLYALCGFANLGSVGILLSGLGVMAPTRKNDFIAVSGRALVGAILASCITGYIVGVI